MSDSIQAVDLFCGAGGLSAGLALAAESLDRDVDLAAVNHDAIAVESHKANHPWARHYNAKVEELHPPEVFDPGIDIVAGGFQCTHFSNARGSAPVNEQMRTSPMHLLHWVELLRPEHVLVENVPEFRKWGPVDEDGTPSRDGSIFERWVDLFASLGYSVDWRVLNAADYGDATSRRRLFVVGRRNNRAAFPEPTHSKSGDDLQEWRSAAEIIDWSDTGESIWQRDRPLVNNTMQRIAEGLRRYASEDLEPFADAVADLEKADVERLQQTAVDVTDLDDAHVERGEPFLVKYYGTSTALSVHDPLDTVTAGGNKFALATPYVLGQQSNATPRAVTDQPLPTVATRGAISVLNPNPFILPRNGYQRGLHSNPAYNPAERPVHTITAQNHDGHVVRPYLVPYFSEREGQRPRTHDIDAPLPTVTATGSDPYVAQPYLVQYYGNSDACSVDEPLPTVTTKDRFALVVPECWPWGLDIHYRMLQPPELAAAMGFPAGYEFAGNKTETTRQIGNAVPVNLAKALITKLLTGDEPSLSTFTPNSGVEADD
ncbi:DNA cytosine methyltransferase [Halomarina oriensis]|uniref:DNA cytosine methyltransferase n=1 Tax=Halomarina oriensis TaxID=671145 RepID=UPI0034A464EC